MYDHANQDGDPAIAGVTAYHSARTASAIAACLTALADEAAEAGLQAVAVFIEAAATMAGEEAQRLRPLAEAAPVFARPSLVWSAPPPESA